MYRIRITASGPAAEALEVMRYALVNTGLTEDRIVEEKDRTRASLCLFEKTADDALILYARIRGLKAKGVRVSLTELKDSGWKERWKKYFKPFNITPRIHIIPAWVRKPKIPKGKKIIFIDTTFAFGTGAHATTWMMAQMIESKKGKFKTFLDIGTGSGILSLIAGVCGAEKVYAIDMDRDSVATAMNNFRLNSFRPAYCLVRDLADYTAEEKFDFVAANLLTADLIRLRSRLVPKVTRGGWLAVSGIHQDNYRSFRKEFSFSGLKVESVRKKKDWYALLLRRK